MSGPDDLREGYYKTRLYSRGPWVPVRVLVEPGIPAHYEAPANPVLRCQWWPESDNPFSKCEIDPFYQGRGCMPVHYFFHPIEKDEFEWMLLLKAM